MQKIILTCLFISLFLGIQYSSAQQAFTFPSGESVALKGTMVYNGFWNELTHQVYVEIGENKLTVSQTKLDIQNNHKNSVIEIQTIDLQNVDSEFDKESISENKGAFLVSVFSKDGKPSWEDYTISQSDKEQNSYISVQIKFDTKKQAQQFIKNIQKKCK